MKKFLIGLILGLVAVPLAVFFYFSTGNAPVATSAEPMPFEKMLAKKALHARLDKEMPKAAPPVPADEGTYMAGAAIYKDHCAVCHGLPGQDQTAIAKGMFPKPPKLMDGKGVTDDPAGETYWKVAGGIRMTGMPGFEKTLTTTQMWQVSVLMANADKASKVVMDSLTATLPAPLPASVSSPMKK
jgi:mono/diheme cytochrome c family protein